MSSKIITRFAPSPTGNLHIGGFRTALFNYLYAKHFGGKVLLRIEDTDKERSKPEYEKNIFEGLEWLGLSFDGIYKQSEREEIYKEYLKKLVDSGAAYISKETVTEEGQRAEVIRFKNPNIVITFSDIIRGEVSFDTTDLGDFVIAKSMSEPIYHLAVVIDDHEMGVTHVIRGEEHVSNTPRQILIGRAIGAKQPIYAHLPLILAPDRTKLSKRKGAKALTDYRDLGYIPSALTNYMALLGWNPGDEREIFSLSELEKEFNLEKVQKSGAIFNEVKLRWVNKEHMRKIGFDKSVQHIHEFFEKGRIAHGKKWGVTQENIIRLLPIITERIEVFTDIVDMIGAGEFDYFFEKPSYEAKDLIWKEDTSENTLKHLSYVIKILESADEEDFTSSERLKSLIWGYATEKGRGNVLWPIRFALTGRSRSPDPFELMTIFEKKKSIERLKDAEGILKKD